LTMRTKRAAPTRAGRKLSSVSEDIYSNIRIFYTNLCLPQYLPNLALLLHRRPFIRVASHATTHCLPSAQTLGAVHISSIFVLFSIFFRFHSSPILLDSAAVRTHFCRVSSSLNIVDAIEYLAVYSSHRTLMIG
jgi:hypothetical protein